MQSLTKTRKLVQDAKVIAATLADRTPGWPIVGTLAWLASEGRFLDDPNELTRQLGDHLNSAGAPLIRLRLSVRFDDDLPIKGWAAVWQLGHPFQADRIGGPDLKSSPGYIGSPLEILDRTRQPFRTRLDREALNGAHRILKELAAQGATDYVALPMPYASGHLASMVIVTDRIGGFQKSDISKFKVLALTLASALEAAGDNYARTLGLPRIANGH